MANKIKFTVVDNTTIELLEDAKKGDHIDLSEFIEIDTSKLSSSIQKEIEKIKSQAHKDVEQAKTQTRQEVKDELTQQIKAELQKDFEIQKLNFKNTLNEVFKDKETELKDEISAKNEQILKKDNAHYKEITNQKEIFEERIRELQNQISDLNRETKKATKSIGENLEQWCDNEFKNAQLCGAFEYCTWNKDNISVKDDNDHNKKGTKADYIFKSYASSAMNDDEILTSVCCEMKSEDHTSSNKQTNKSHWAKLESDRKKKNCEYALLITELEMENDFVVQKVKEYPNMYMVRPRYFVIFLGLLNTIAIKFKGKELKLIAQEKKLNQEYLTKQEIEDNLIKLKNVILNNSVKNIESNAANIKKNSENIIVLANKSWEQADTIINTHISSLSNKINDLNLRKILKTSDGKIHYEVLKDFGSTQDVILANKNKNR